ncbi:MAG TPA: 30S ribosomal protein S1, partial [Candidatus Methylomirabilis sp.]
MTSQPVHSGAQFSTDPEEEEQSGPSTEMQEIYERSVRDIVEGDIVKGTILGIKDDAVLVDIGYKSEGVIS